MSSDQRNFQRPTNDSEWASYLRAIARQGADKIHAAGTPLEKRHKPTPAEDLARARARADKDQP